MWRAITVCGVLDMIRVCDLLSRGRKSTKLRRACAAASVMLDVVPVESGMHPSGASLF